MCTVFNCADHLKKLIIMKTLVSTIALLLISLVSNSQVYNVSMTSYTDFVFPKEMSLGEAMTTDKIVIIGTWGVKGDYVINFDDNIFTMIDYTDGGKTKTYQITEANQNDNFISFFISSSDYYAKVIISENVNNATSIIVQDINLLDGKKQGFFCNSVILTKKS